MDSSGSYAVVAWDLDTTGRRLLDEICQIGAFTKECGPAKQQKQEAKEDGSDKGSDDEEEEEDKAAEEEKAKKDESSGGRSFSQYVMPHKNPNPGARRSFGIR